MRARIYSAFPLLLIALLGFLGPEFAARSLGGAHVVDRGPDASLTIDSQLLALPVRVLSFDVAGAEWAKLALLATVLLVALVAWYAFSRSERLSLRYVALAQGVAGLALALSRVSFNPDPTSYILFARLYGVFGINPYPFPPPIPHDGLLQQLAPLWGSPVSGDVYGPLWTLLVAAIAYAEAHASLLAQWITQRLLAVLAAVATSFALARIFRHANGGDADRTARSVAGFALHPLVLLETAVDGHNDMLMVACAAWAFALLDESPLLAGVLLGASVAVKFVSIVVAPFFLIALWRAHGRALRAPILAAAAMAAVVVLSSAPFHLSASSAHAMSRSQGGMGVAVSLASLLRDGYLAIHPAAALGESFPGQRSWPILRHADIGQVLDAGLVALWCGLALVLLRRYVRNGRCGELFAAMTAFLWVCPSIGSYYLVWLSPLLADRGGWGRYANALLMTAMLYYLQGLLPGLPWERTTQLYVIALLFIPAAWIGLRKSSS